MRPVLRTCDVHLQPRDFCSHDQAGNIPPGGRGCDAGDLADVAVDGTVQHVVAVSTAGTGTSTSTRDSAADARDKVRRSLQVCDNHRVRQTR